MFRRIAWMAALVVSMSQALLAQSITGLSPNAVAPGKSIDVKVRGGGLNAPTDVWTSFKSETTLPADIQGNGTNAAEVTYRMNVPADVAPGIYGLRIATGTGVSNLRLIAVDDLPSVGQARPNQAVANAQALTLPTAVDGYVENLTRDYYKFTVTAGQRVAFEVLARRLGSPLDATMRLLDARGRELAYTDDVSGIAPDCRFVYTFKDAGEYTLEVRDIRWQGSGNHHYRLRVGDFPLITVPYPMAVARGTSANVNFAGDPNAQPVAFNLPGDFAQEWLNLGARLPSGQSSGFGVLAVSPGAQALETEPNNDAAQATRVEAGASINGRIDTPGDTDRYVFTAKAGQRFVFTGVTRSQGSPTDLNLVLLKADGGQVAAAEDAGPNEGVIDFNCPADGDYTLVVSDLLRRGGPEFAYHIEVVPFAIRFDLAVSADTLNIGTGGVGTLTVTTTRVGYGGPISLALVGAPDGLVASPSVIGPGLNTTTLTITAGAAVPSGKIYNLKIEGTGQQGETVLKSIATVTAAQKAAFNSLTVPPPALSETVAVGIAPAPQFTLKTSAPEITFGKDLSATIKVIATKAAGFDEEIAIAVLPPQNGLPAGVTAAVKNIPKGQTEVDIVFAANNQAPLGSFSAVLQGTGKAGNVTTVQPIPSLGLKLDAPYTLKPDFAGGKLVKGQSLTVKINVDRNPAYAGPITLTFQNLPKGVTAPAASIAAGQATVDVVLTAAADAAVGEVKNITVTGEGVNGNAKLPGVSGAQTLVVE